MDDVPLQVISSPPESSPSPSVEVVDSATVIIPHGPLSKEQQEISKSFIHHGPAYHVNRI